MVQQSSSTDNFSPVSLINKNGKSAMLIVCEHASNFMPSQFENLGLSNDLLDNHIAWDPGAAKVALHLSELFDAPYVQGEVSRLVYDCNRPPESVEAMRDKSETHDIPGNQNLSGSERRYRIENVYEPFKRCVEDALVRLPANSVLVTIHSFTAVYFGQKREVELGILHDTDSTLADGMLSIAHNHTDLVTKRNEPYGPEDGVTHTAQVHGVANGIPNVMIEIRSDLISTPKDCKTTAEMLHRLIGEALSNLESDYATRRHA